MNNLDMLRKKTLGKITTSGKARAFTMKIGHDFLDIQNQREQ